MLKWKKRGILLLNSTASLLVGALLMFPGVVAAQEDDQARPIVRPAKLDTEEDIIRFIKSVLADRIQRPDPFVRKSAQALGGEDSYQVENKPRPVSGFGRYDVDTLTLMAIWQDEEGAVAMFKAQDSKVFIIRVGEEAYDGRVVEINLEAGYVRFLQELRLTGTSSSKRPNVKYEEKIVPFRR